MSYNCSNGKSSPYPYLWYWFHFLIGMKIIHKHCQIKQLMAKRITYSILKPSSLQTPYVFLFKFCFMGAGNQKSFFIVHHYFISINRPDMPKIDDIWYMNMGKRLIIKLFPYFFSCHICLEIFWNRMYHCLRPFFSKYTISSQLIRNWFFRNWKTKVALYHMKILHGF